MGWSGVVGGVPFLFSVFFFQAEDGIRDIGVTGVQTCALPIFATPLEEPGLQGAEELLFLDLAPRLAPGYQDLVPADLVPRLDGLDRKVLVSVGERLPQNLLVQTDLQVASLGGEGRSEERRVGKECRSRWS